MLSSFGRPDRIAKASFALQPLRKISRSSKISTATVAALLETPASNTPGDVAVTGFVRSVRKQKKHAFVTLGDGSSYEPLQAVVHPDHAHG